jgi:hypothetical protein
MSVFVSKILWSTSCELGGKFGECDVQITISSINKNDLDPELFGKQEEREKSDDLLLYINDFKTPPENS